MLETRESPEELLTSLRRQRTAKLVAVMVGLLLALITGALVVVAMFAD
jgi:hypothetical protein